jgi:hypothetical protein
MSLLGGDGNFDDGAEDISPEDVARAEAKAKRDQAEEDYVFDELMRAIPESDCVYWDSRLVDSIAFHRREFQAMPAILAIAAVCVTACGLFYRQFHAAGASCVFLPISYGFRRFLKEYPKTYSVTRFVKSYKQDNTLRLNCERLSDKAFQFLGQCGPGIKLHLDELETLTLLAAKYLAKFHGHLSTRGLIYLLPEVEAELRKRPDWEKPVACRSLSSDSLEKSELVLLLYETYLSAVDVLRIIDVIEKGSDLDLSVEKITVELASLLAAKCQGKLTLNHLTTITPEVAEALAKHEGDLFLNGLTTLSPEALKILRASPKIRLPSKFDKKP